MQGGFKDNVIPREANAELLISAEDTKGLADEYAKISISITDIMSKYQKELAGSEPELNFQIEDLGDDTYDALHPVSFEKMLFLLINTPNGVQVMSSNIEGLIESSLNIGIFRTDADKVELFTSVRSSLSSYKYYLSDKLNYLTSFLGGEYVVRWEYPAWEYKKDSKLRDHFQKISREFYGKEMKVEAIHAGLECGLIYEKMPGLDIVSIGPDITGVHKIEERMDIPSAVRVYKFLEKIVKEKIGD
jgi:dipeptidase D